MKAKQQAEKTTRKRYSDEFKDQAVNLKTAVDFTP